MGETGEGGKAADMSTTRRADSHVMFEKGLPNSSRLSCTAERRRTTNI